MSTPLRIGTRDSQLAVWQASWVQQMLQQHGIASELIYIKSEGDLDTVTPLYALGVQGIFTRSLDAALLAGRIDLAVHSMKDVPVQLAEGIIEAAVLTRASSKDLFVYKGDLSFMEDHGSSAVIATSSIRRMAQWKHRYPDHTIENLRGNVNTRLKKLEASTWNGAVFAAAGLDRIELRPDTSIELDWMLPAPAQGAVMVVCRENNKPVFENTRVLNDDITALCTHAERAFLSALHGGCSTPISALATVRGNNIFFSGNITSPDGKLSCNIEKTCLLSEGDRIGSVAAKEILQQGGEAIVSMIRRKGLVTDGEA